MKSHTLIFSFGVLLTGCTLAPFYHRPPLPVPTQWENGGHPTHAAAADIGWQDFFKDPRLQTLIAIALQNNRDLRVATLNVAAARAQYRIQRSDLFPTVSATATELAQRQPNIYGFPGYPLTTHEYEAGLGFTAYELDLFGRIRSMNKQALETYFSYAETRNSAQITLISELATQYLTWLADQNLLTLTQETLAAQKASFELTKLRFDAGISTALDLSQAKTAVDAAAVNLAQYTRQVAQDLNALTLLLGASLPADLPPGSDFNHETLLTDIPEGLPSDLLERRPDIRAAEHLLLAANANIGAARAAFFPSISLTGNFGTASAKLNGLFKDGSQAWVFNPQINLPIFAGGANFANLNLAHIEKNIQIAQYEKAIQTAFREVADGLAGRQTFDDQVAAQESLVMASSESYKLSEMRFRSGIDNYLSVIVSQRELYTAEQQLISAKLLRMENLVTLYKVLGGGWSEKSQGPVPTTPTTTAQPATAAAPTVSTAALTTIVN